MATVNLGSTNAADANNGALSQDKTEFHSDCKDAPFGFCFPVMSIVLDKQSFDKSLIAVEERKIVDLVVLRSPSLFSCCFFGRCNAACLFPF